MKRQKLVDKATKQIVKDLDAIVKAKYGEYLFDKELETGEIEEGLVGGIEKKINEIVRNVIDLVVQEMDEITYEESIAR